MSREHPNGLYYTQDHEWARVDGQGEKKTATVGITQYAVDQLTDVTHLQLPKVGTQVTAEKPFGEIESVKAVFDLYAPVTGEVGCRKHQVRASESARMRDAIAST